MKNGVYIKEYKKFIERLKQARLSAGLRQEDVAVRVGKPQSYLSKLESGERRADIIELAELAKIYKKDVSFFV